MLRRMLGEDFTLRVALDPDLCRVRVDPGQIGQVLMNLCVNARDAMRAAARWRSTTRARRMASALIVVSDNGRGIPDDVRARVFEPFFTTKAVGKGTGLGLAVVHGIVEQAGGSIELDSRVGIGTTFRIRLPGGLRPGSSTRSARRSRARGQWAHPARRATTSTSRDRRDPHAQVARLRGGRGGGWRAMRYACLRQRERRSADHRYRDAGHERPASWSRRRRASIPQLRVLYTSGYTDDEHRAPRDSPGRGRVPGEAVRGGCARGEGQGRAPGRAVR